MALEQPTLLASADDRLSPDTQEYQPDPVFVFHFEESRPAVPLPVLVAGYKNYELLKFVTP